MELMKQVSALRQLEVQVGNFPNVTVSISAEFEKYPTSRLYLSDSASISP